MTFRFLQEQNGYLLNLQTCFNIALCINIINLTPCIKHQKSEKNNEFDQMILIYVITYWDYKNIQPCAIRLKRHKEVTSLGSQEYFLEHYSQFLITQKQSQVSIMRSHSSNETVNWGETFFSIISGGKKALPWGEQTMLRSDMWGTGSNSCISLDSMLPWKIQMEFFSSLQTTGLHHNLINEQRKGIR